MRDNIDVRNCIDIWKLAKTFDISDLTERGAQFIAMNIQFVPSEKLRDLCFDEIKEIVHFNHDEVMLYSTFWKIFI